MARKPRLFAPGVLYHVIVRGNQRQKTFAKERDYQVYLEKLAQLRIPAQIGTDSAGKATLVPIEIGTCSDANRHPCLG